MCKFKVNGYVVDYTPLSNEEIAAPAVGDEILKTGNWVPVNRREPLKKEQSDV